MGRQSRASHSPNRWLRRGREGEARVYARGSSPPSFTDTSILLSRVIAICDPAKSPPRIPPRNRTHAHTHTYIYTRSFLPLWSLQFSPFVSLQFLSLPSSYFSFSLREDFTTFSIEKNPRDPNINILEEKYYEWKKKEKN